MLILYSDSLDFAIVSFNCTAMHAFGNFVWIKPVYKRILFVEFWCNFIQTWVISFEIILRGVDITVRVKQKGIVTQELISTFRNCKFASSYKYRYEFGLSE